MNKFINDLASWKEWEERVLNILRENWYKVSKNDNERWVDLLLTFWIEVKTDLASIKTWNFYIETMCNWKTSWIFKEEEYPVAYWAITDKIKVYLLDIDDLIEEIKTKKHRVITNWWDWWRSQWVLIPVKCIEKLAYNIFNY